MANSIWGWLYLLLVVCLCVWRGRAVVKDFGWQGLLIKLALLILGGFLMLIVGYGEMPWTAVRRNTHMVGNPASCGATFFFWAYFFIARRPMRWLLMPPVKWLLYVTTASVFMSLYAAHRGWL